MTRIWNLALAAGVIGLVAVPLLPGVGGGKAFLGTDDQAKDAIKDASPGYEPWTEPVWEPPSGEVQTLLFTTQAAVGAGVLGYVLGYFRGRKARAGGADG
ncbi:energy-coupling factor ABC transporter substrate-binding protein [bacterium]|nr:energy-coupling factor ABC transporter substrate-binding protein [bacterium]